MPLYNIAVLGYIGIAGAKGAKRMKRSHLIIYVSMAAVIATGCSIDTIRNKADRYKEVAEKTGDPDEVCVVYSRKGEVTSGFERRCFGAACDNLPSCERSE